MLETNSDSHRFLIIGLGNPGEKYAKTRHNLGHVVLKAIADELGLGFKQEKKLQSEVAKGNYQDTSVVLLFPTTYMNLSGHAVAKSMHYYKFSPSEILVIVDDVDLPLGSLRFRLKGSPGGHNGLKSIQQSIGTQEYPRLRLGVGDRKQGHLEDHVLGQFHANELPVVEKLIETAKESVFMWVSQGIEAAMTFASTKQNQKNHF